MLLVEINASYGEDDAFFLVGPRMTEEGMRDKAMSGYGFFLVQRAADLAHVGCFHLSHVKHAGDTAQIELSTMTVFCAFKRAGYARAIVKLAECEAQARGASAIELEVVSVKPWLQAFYASFGYEPVETRPWPDGGPMRLTQPCEFGACEQSAVMRRDFAGFANRTPAYMHSAQSP